MTLKASVFNTDSDTRLDNEFDQRLGDKPALRKLWKRLAEARQPIDRTSFQIFAEYGKHVSCLEQLPMELVVLISEFLEPESKIAFSLVSRTYYALIGPSAVRALAQDKASKARLLRLLEVDNTRSLLCVCCNRLFDWRSNRNRSSEHIQCGRCDRHGWAWSLTACSMPQYHLSKLNGSCFCPGAFHGTGAEIDLLILRHTRGQRYGLPFDDLNHSCIGHYDKDSLWTTESSRGPDDFYVARNSVAKIIDGRVLVHTTLTFIFDRTCNSLSQLAHVRRSGCCGRRFALQAAVLCAWIHVEKGELPRPDERPERACQQLLRCYSCERDYKIHFSRGTHDTELICTLHVYQDLGGRSELSPMHTPDHHWYGWRFTGPTPEEEARLGKVLTRDLEKSFHSERMVTIPRAANSCILSEYYYTSGEEYLNLLRLPDYGAGGVFLVNERVTSLRRSRRVEDLAVNQIIKNMVMGRPFALPSQMTEARITGVDGTTTDTDYRRYLERLTVADHPEWLQIPYSESAVHSLPTAGTTDANDSIREVSDTDMTTDQSDEDMFAGGHHIVDITSDDDTQFFDTENLSNDVSNSMEEEVEFLLARGDADDLLSNDAWETEDNTNSDAWETDNEMDADFQSLDADRNRYRSRRRSRERGFKSLWVPALMIAFTKMTRGEVHDGSLFPPERRSI